MKNMNKHVDTSRGLLGVLCVVITLTTNSMNVMASSTIDDLKSYIGITVEKIEDKSVNVSEYIESTEKHSEELDEKEETTQPIDIAKDKLANLNAELEQYMLNDTSGFKILDTIDSIIETKNEIESLGYVVKQEYFEDDSESTPSVAYDATKDIKSIWYNIGSIGDYLKFCITPFVITKPYGYEVVYNYETEEYEKVGEKNTVLELQADENTVVTSIFNGKIYSIEKDTEGVNTSNICINHGNGLYTIYRHVNVNENIKKGDTVSQYDEIGTVGKSTDADEMHLGIQVILDSTYINPLIIYGSSGENIYKKFLSSTDKEYAVGASEEYYYNSDMSVENPNK